MKTFIWEITKVIGLDVQQKDDYTIVVKQTSLDIQKTEVTNWGQTCTKEEAQDYIDKRWPGHIVLRVYEK